MPTREPSNGPLPPSTSGLLTQTVAANSPCMFGVNSSFGLPEPVLMNNVTIHVEHITNSTYGHHGEMGLPQAMLAYDIYE